jgi:diacylglycerol kinase (ATP)
MKRLINSFGFAIRGFRAAISTQPNLRIHLVASLVVIALGFILSVTVLEWCVLLLCIGLVISAELFNTAIEKVVDMVSPEWNDKAGRVKDIAAAAVLVLAFISLVIGCIIFGKHFFQS